MYPIVDIHMHVVPHIDDGARNFEESLELLKLAQKQGVTDVFCTSHSGGLKENSNEYYTNFEKLKELADNCSINIRLHKGCETLCSRKIISETLHYIETGAFSALGESNYLLTELYPDIELEEALFIIDELKKHGYNPIIAHAERIFSLSCECFGTIIENGALIQVNADNLVDITDIERRRRARELLKNKYIHFIGSDGHQLISRPPLLSNGVDYILSNTDENYASEILNKNLSYLINLD